MHSEHPCRLLQLTPSLQLPHIGSVIKKKLVYFIYSHVFKILVFPFLFLRYVRATHSNIVFHTILFMYENVIKLIDSA